MNKASIMAYGSKLIIFGAAVVTLSLSGCSSKDVTVSERQDNRYTLEVKQVDTFTKARAINSTNTRLFQSAAEETIKSGYQYFLFDSPRYLNLGDTDSFLKKCANNSVAGNLALGVATLGLGATWVSDDCSLFDGLTTASFGSSMSAMSMYKEKQEGAYDALEVIAQLKMKKLFNESYTTEYATK